MMKLGHEVDRLLRNRVSAQQARERKKVYVSDQESRAQELQEMNSKLEEKISTLVNENTMLRKVREINYSWNWLINDSIQPVYCLIVLKQVLMNTRPKVDESSTEPTTTHDQLSKSWRTTILIRERWCFSYVATVSSSFTWWSWSVLARPFDLLLQLREAYIIDLTDYFDILCSVINKLCPELEQLASACMHAAFIKAGSH